MDNEELIKRQMVSELAWHNILMSYLILKEYDNPEYKKQAKMVAIQYLKGVKMISNEGEDSNG